MQSYFGLLRVSKHSALRETPAPQSQLEAFQQTRRLSSPSILSFLGQQGKGLTLSLLWTQVDYIVVEASVSGEASVKQRVHQILNQRKASIKTIRNIVREYAGNIGDQATADPDANEAEVAEAREQERQYLTNLVDKFWSWKGIFFFFGN